MASPINSSALLQVDNDAGGVTFNAGFTFTAGRDAILLLNHFATGQTITGVTIGGTTATLDVALNKFLTSDNSARIYRAQNIAGGTANIVITVSGGTDHYISGAVHEWAAGDLTASALDTGTGNTATGTSAAPSASTATSTSQANTIIYALLCPSTGVTNDNITGPSGWNVMWTEQNSSAHEGGRGAWIEEASAGTKTATFGMTSGDWGVAIVAYKLSAASGTYTITADQGLYSLTGQAANTLFNKTVIANQGSYSLTGQNAALSLSSSSVLTAETGNYFLVGSSVLIDFAMNAEQGFYNLTGQSVNFVYGSLNSYSIVANSGNYTLSGQAANTLFNKYIINEQGSYTLTGRQVGLVWSGAPVSTGRGYSRITISSLYMGL